jgi:hypothetical protein
MMPKRKKRVTFYGYVLNRDPDGTTYYTLLPPPLLPREVALSDTAPPTNQQPPARDTRATRATRAAPPANDCVVM